VRKRQRLLEEIQARRRSWHVESAAVIHLPSREHLDGARSGGQVQVARHEVVVEIEPEPDRPVEAGLVLPVVPPHAGAAPCAAVSAHDGRIRLLEVRVDERPARRRDVSGSASNRVRPPAESAERAIEMRLTRPFGGVAREPRRQLAVEHTAAGGCERKRRMHEVDDAAHRLRAVQHAGWSANQLDPLREPGLDGRRMTPAELLVVQSHAVVQHTNPIFRDPPDHRRAQGVAGRDECHARDLRERLAERRDPVAPHLRRGDEIGLLRGLERAQRPRRSRDDDLFGVLEPGIHAHGEGSVERDGD
jgi:hypothetical protein